jgi:type 1 glutamine amidotransferase
MGEDHPVIWSHCIGRGRSIYSALGHLADAYSEPEHLRFLEEAVGWVMVTPPAGCDLSRP